MALVQQGRLTDEQIAKREADRVAKNKKIKEERTAAEKKAIENLMAEDAKKIAKAQKEAMQAENEVLQKQIKEREEYLATPLSEKDQARMSLLETIANSGQSVPVDLMKELADLRIRAKANKDKKDK